MSRVLKQKPSDDQGQSAGEGVAQKQANAYELVEEFGCEAMWPLLEQALRESPLPPI